MKLIKQLLRGFLYSIQFSILKMSDDEMGELLTKYKLW